MTIQDAGRKLLFQLYHLYDQREAANIADWVMENITGWKKIDRLLNKEVTLSQPMKELLTRYTAQLNNHTPVQYVLEEAWFCGLKFFVDKNVLIPRPETEELVRWLINDLETLPAENTRILDIGTGSGCIPITIKKELKEAILFACDISAAALEIARKNAETHATPVDFIQADILDKTQWSTLPFADIIISNPPYIPLEEKQGMHKNVVLHEPHEALFVRDNDPLIFYKAIADIALAKLSEKGTVYVETHEKLARDTAAVFAALKFHTEIRKDMQGRERMIKAVLSGNRS